MDIEQLICNATKVEIEMITNSYLLHRIIVSFPRIRLKPVFYPRVAEAPN